MPAASRRFNYHVPEISQSAAHPTINLCLSVEPQGGLHKRRSPDASLRESGQSWLHNSNLSPERRKGPHFFKMSMKRMENTEGWAFRQQLPKERCVAHVDFGHGALCGGVSRETFRILAVSRAALRATNSYRLRASPVERKTELQGLLAYRHRAPRRAQTHKGWQKPAWLRTAHCTTCRKAA